MQPDMIIYVIFKYQPKYKTMSKGFHYAFLVLCLAMSSSFYAQIFRLSDYLGENEKDATLAMISLLQDAKTAR